MPETPPAIAPDLDPSPVTPALLACAVCGALKCKLRYPEKPADDRSNKSLRCSDCRAKNLIAWGVF